MLKIVFGEVENAVYHPPVRHFALACDDVDGMAGAVRRAGYEVFIEPKDIVIQSAPAYPARIAFCTGPLGEEIELFQEQ